MRSSSASRLGSFDRKLPRCSITVQNISRNLCFNKIGICSPDSSMEEIRDIVSMESEVPITPSQGHSGGTQLHYPRRLDVELIKHYFRSCIGSSYI